MSYSYSVSCITNDDINHIHNVRKWLIQNFKSKNWTTYKTQRSAIYDFIFYSKKDYTAFLLRWT